MNLVQIRRPSTSFAMPFRHRQVGGKVLITSTEGNFLLLTPDEFARFAEGDVPDGTPLYTRGARDGGREVGIQRAVRVVRLIEALIERRPQ